VEGLLLAMFLSFFTSIRRGAPTHTVLLKWLLTLLSSNMPLANSVEFGLYLWMMGTMHGSDCSSIFIMFSYSALLSEMVSVSIGVFFSVIFIVFSILAQFTLE
jgi:hypothetical protein